jgi:23S rRNA pseudouridine955/2504/2580 synthase
MTQIVTETVSLEEEGARLDRWVKRRVPMTQAQLERLLRTGQIRVDGARAKASHRLNAGQEVRLPFFKPDESGKPFRPARGQDTESAFLKALVIHEDDEMIVLNKPAGLAVQGGTGQGRHVDGMLDALQSGEHRPALVHRLDKDTSGLLMLAKHPAAAARLGEMFRGRDIEKVYWAVTVGVPSPQHGQIRCWMVKAIPDDTAEGGYRLAEPGGKRRDSDRERMVRSAQGVEGARHAITDYAVITTAGQRAAWVALRPHTGRMHQLRLHMLEMNTSILGDRKYKSRREVPHGLADGLHLHARGLVIPRPRGAPLTLEAPLPDHMLQTFQTLGFLEKEAGRHPLDPFL